MSFYLTLPSTASSREFPDNTQSNFTTLIQPPVEMDGNYSVALTEICCSNRIELDLGSITFPNPFMGLNRIEKFQVSIEGFNGESTVEFLQNLNNEIKHRIVLEEYNFRNRLVKGDAFMVTYIQETYKSEDQKPKPKLIVLEIDKKYEILDIETSERRDIYISSGCVWNPQLQRYTFADDHKAIINEKFSATYLKAPSRDSRFHVDKLFFYNKPQDPVVDQIMKFILKSDSYPTFEYGNNSLRIRYYNPISYHIKGLMSTLISNGYTNDHMGANTTVSIPFRQYLNLINHAVVLTDIIEDQLYGNVRSPILSTINFKGETIISFENPHYLPVKKSQLSSINIKILDLTSKQIRFSDIFSLSILKLHFRKI
jgi:hypothetical protein